MVYVLFILNEVILSILIASSKVKRTNCQAQMTYWITIRRKPETPPIYPILSFEDNISPHIISYRLSI